MQTGRKIKKKVKNEQTSYQTNMKILFLIFHGFEEANGISKKIRYQVKALRECGADVQICYYDITSGGRSMWLTDEEVLTDLGKGTWSKIKKRFCYRGIIQYASHQKIDLVYMRSYHNANPFTLHLVKKLQQQGAKVVMEIPTYPYDQEYITRRMKLDLFIDRCFRKRLAKRLDGIVTFSDIPIIFGKQTICISNGIDFEGIPMKIGRNDTDRELHLLGVAEVHYWHGFDRIIQGLAKYYGTSPQYKVYFHIVGNLSGEREKQEILPAIKLNKLEEYVILHGNQHGEKLNELFEWADMGIGSLGRHRSGITYIKTLKNREYAARGIPFVYSETDSDFDKRPYVLKVPADETPVDIRHLVDFYRNTVWEASKIRKSVTHLSWKVQMQKVLDRIYPYWE